MTILKKAILALVVAGSMNSLVAQNAKEAGLEAITEQAVKGQLEFLASDWTEGRATGTRGAYMAADYIASIFKIYGLEPGGDEAYTNVSRAERMSGKRPERYRSFYQSFSLVEHEPGEVQKLSLVKTGKNSRQEISFGYETDFSVNAGDAGVNIEAPIVFAGYGYKDDEAGYDDFKGIDTEGKILVCLSGYPGHNDTTSAAFKKIGDKSRWQLYREKRDMIAESGAAAMIEISLEYDRMDYWADNVPFRYNSDTYEGDKPRSSFYETSLSNPGEKIGDGMVMVMVSKRAANTILDKAGIDAEAFEKEVKESLKPASKEVKGITMQLESSVKSKVVRVRNVVGVLPGKDTTEIIVIGGHYDHLGKHDGWIWNGADDNASGTVGVMTIAKAMLASGEKPEKTIVFCAWTGEEKGLLGSEYFADHPWNDAEMILNLNYDMISRDNLDDTLGVKCSMTYTEAYPVLQELAEQHNDEYGLGLDISFRAQEKPRGGSDHTPFANKDVPIFYFMAGFPPEYHSTNDHVEKVNFDKMTKIIKLGYLNVFELAKGKVQSAVGSSQFAVGSGQ